MEAAVQLVQHREAADLKSVASPARIQLRLFEDGDREALYELARASHARTAFGHIPFSRARFDEKVDGQLQSGGRQLGLVAVQDDAPVGFAWAAVGRFAFSDSVPMVTVHALVVDHERLGPIGRAKTFMRLLKAVRLWADRNKAEGVIVNSQFGAASKGTDRMMRAAGAKLLGGGYVL